MSNARVIIASANLQLVTCIRDIASRKPYIESVITIVRPSDVTNKLGHALNNILIWDLDHERHNTSWVSSIRRSFTLNILYTSHDAAPPPILAKTSQDDFVSKPAIFTPHTTIRYAGAINQVMDAFANVYKPDASSGGILRGSSKMVGINDRQKIVVIASSTGGTNALEDVIKGLPLDSPPIVVVQHMPSGFTKLFADRLDALYRQKIKEADTGDFLMRGHILLAPADKHIKIVRRGDKLAVECFVGTRVHGVMPAADILFDSVADIVRNKAVGVVLTGMGNDGARGLKKMHLAGCKTIGQNEATCVVYGMPKAAKDMGAIDFELPLFKIADKILELVR